MRPKTQHLVEHVQKQVQSRTNNYVIVATQMDTEDTQKVVSMVDHLSNCTQIPYSTKCCL